MFPLHKFFGKKICVAFSGGADSTALLHFLLSKREEYGYSLSAVHCEHGIRGEESLRDKAFAQKVCAEWGVELFLFSTDCLALAEREKKSLETAAREFRLECFQALISGGKADYIATAHHVNDEAETVLFRLARGSSLSGARGILHENGWLIRPFLTWTKEEILRYAKENALGYCEDKTNFEPCATRNKLRLEILPALENVVAGATRNLARFAFLAAEDDEYLYRQSEQLLCREKSGGFTIVFSEEKPLFSRACLTALKALGVEKDYTSLHLNSLFSLQSAERGARLDLPKGVRAEKADKGICLYILKNTGEKTLPLGEEKPFSKNGFDGGRYEVNVEKEPPVPRETKWRVLKIDGDKLPKDATFRFRREGDYFEKFGGNTKSLKKFFNEEKIDVKTRACLPLIASKEGGEVYVVCGVEISQRLKITENTRNALYITITKKENE